MACLQPAGKKRLLCRLLLAVTWNGDRKVVLSHDRLVCVPHGDGPFLEEDDLVERPGFVEKLQDKSENARPCLIQNFKQVHTPARPRDEPSLCSAERLTCSTSRDQTR